MALALTSMVGCGGEPETPVDNAIAAAKANPREHEIVEQGALELRFDGCSCKQTRVACEGTFLRLPGEIVVRSKRIKPTVAVKVDGTTFHSREQWRRCAKINEHGYKYECRFRFQETVRKAVEIPVEWKPAVTFAIKTGEGSESHRKAARNNWARVSSRCKECVKDAQCDDGSSLTVDTCESNRCVHTRRPQCTDDDDCGTNEQCQSNGVCKEVSPRKCQVNGDCGSGQMCSNGTCQAIPPTRHCQSDEDCPHGEACSNHGCVIGRPPWARCDNGDRCAEGQICLRNRYCKTQCSANQQCKVHERCSRDGLCEEMWMCPDGPQNCLMGEQCLASQCVTNRSCQVDAECPVGLICDRARSFCTRRPLTLGSCETDADCKWGAPCHERRCVAPPGRCYSDADCGVRETCLNTRCIY